MVDKGGHAVAVCRKDGDWMYAAKSMGDMLGDDQAFCIQRNFEAELRLNPCFSDIPAEDESQ